MLATLAQMLREASWRRWQGRWQSRPKERQCPAAPQRERQLVLAKPNYDNNEETDLCLAQMGHCFALSRVHSWRREDRENRETVMWPAPTEEHMEPASEPSVAQVYVGRVAVATMPLAAIAGLE
mmetsp:Transcript_37469/g.82185  ORF Transcript_37469/g.82185 Transcript_37469/m.82185 type:complete len:124 (+) Transcript_37469:535-906(+)